MKPAFIACAPLAGPGACREAWDAATTGKKYPQMLTDMITACATQHCAALTGTKPAACTGKPDGWAGKEIPTWVELHAAVLGQVFPDQIKVSPAIMDKYKALPLEPTADQLRAFQTEFAKIDPVTATVDGREVVFGVAARQLGAVFFAPAAKMTMQVPLTPTP